VVRRLPQKSAATAAGCQRKSRAVHSTPPGSNRYAANLPPTFATHSDCAAANLCCHSSPARPAMMIGLAMGRRKNVFGETLTDGNRALAGLEPAPPARTGAQGRCPTVHPRPARDDRDRPPRRHPLAAASAELETPGALADPGGRASRSPQASAVSGQESGSFASPKIPPTTRETRTAACAKVRTRHPTSSTTAYPHEGTITAALS
jgi:hypothetical protein